MTRILAVALAANLSGRASAQMPTTVTVNARATWKIGQDYEGPEPCIGRGVGTWTLGDNTAIAGKQIDNKDAIHGFYTPGTTFLQAFAADSGPTGAVTHSIAFSFMHIDERLRIDCYKPYELRAFAVVTIFGQGPRGSALASVTDPQFVNSPGFAFATVGLGPESGVFSSGQHGNVAMTTLSLTAPLLTEPLASIRLEHTGGAVEATVEFNADPNLGFFHPVTLAPLTAQDVEMVLESNSDLATEGGLMTDLDLFFYEYELTAMTLPQDAAFGSFLESIAIAVPEPGSLALLCIAGLLIGHVRRRLAG